MGYKIFIVFFLCFSLLANDTIYHLIVVRESLVQQIRNEIDSGDLQLAGGGLKNLAIPLYLKPDTNFNTIRAR